MQGDTTWRLTAFPLTPIHVGDGSVLAAEAWRLGADRRLERFSPAAVLRAAQPRTRADYVRALEMGKLGEAQAALRNAVRPEQVLERLAVGAAARQELEQTLGNPLRKGEVRPFLRTGARPYLPGSSLKGALRTALLSALVGPHKQAIEAKKRDHRTARGSIASRASNEIQAILLGHENPDQDPFRFLEVADILLPEAATRVDRVVNWRPPRSKEKSEQPAEKMQMIFEVTDCLALGRALPLPCTIRIEAGSCRAARALDPVARHGPRGPREREKTPKQAIAPEALARAVNAFHWKLWDWELERFYAGERAIADTLRRLLRVKAPDGTLLGPDQLPARTDILLLRLGRFGQFESKSLDGVREGWNAQVKPPRPMKEGNTRNLVKTAAAGALLPLGWLLLLPEGFEPVVQAAATAATGPTRRDAPSPAGRAFYQGEEVVVRQRGRGELLIEFPGGDTEWVDASELEWR